MAGTPSVTFLKGTHFSSIIKLLMLFITSLNYLQITFQPNFFHTLQQGALLMLAMEAQAVFTV
jgi:hypothetical protein